jgi:ferritin-like metal-binding protein YciE
MPQITDLSDLLKHEILDLYSAEVQIIDALPKMIDKAKNRQLKTALNDHLKVTELQKARLDEIKGLMGEKQDKDSGEKKGFFSKLFGGSGTEKCKGTEGLIKEGEKIMGEDMSPQVMDAAIIGAAQKIEHYEISGYGTAVAYARELGLSNVAGLLQQTLDEEYTADDSLTKLAVGNLNVKAENATMESSKRNSSNNKGSKETIPLKSSLSKGNGVSKSNISRVVSKSNTKGNTSTGNSKSSKSSGNKSAGKSLSKAAGKSSGKSLSAGKSKSGKNKSSKQR